MVTKCCICAAEENSIHRQRFFHKIPKNEEMRQKWFKIIGRNVSYKGAKICSDHFRVSDYHEMNIYKKRMTLKRTAVPFSPLEEESEDMKKDLNTFIDANIDTSITKDTDMHICIKEEIHIYENIIEDANMDTSITKDADMHISIKEEKDMYTNIIEDADMHISIKEEKDMYTNIVEDADMDINITKVADMHTNTTEDIDMQTNNTENSNNVNIERISNRKRKLPQNKNIKVKKIFLNTSKYSTERFQESDFLSNKKWEQFLRCISYHRHKVNIIRQKKRRLQNKVLILKDLLQELKSKNLITNNSIDTIQISCI